MLAASIVLHQVETTKGEPTQQLQESLVKDGPTQSPMTTPSPIWVITTSVEIQLGLMPSRGAILLTPTLNGSTVQFLFALP